MIPDPTTAAMILRTGLLIWVAILGAAVFYQIITNGQILRQLMTHDRRSIDPERVAELGAVILVVGGYLSIAGFAPVQDASTGAWSMPDIPESLLVLLGGGKTIYLAGKMTRNRS